MILAELEHQHTDAIPQDFSVFYALMTDAKAYGRMWNPPASYLGVSHQSVSHFTFLSARETRDTLLRKALSLSRLGLSSTFPRTIRALDGWLEESHAFSQLHAGQPWLTSLASVIDEVVEARTRFLHALVRALTEDPS